MNDGARLDQTVCPLCGSANECAMETEKATGMAQPPCWCSTLSIDARLIEQIPKASRGLACICPACAQRPLAAASAASRLP